jgi:predicted lipoprotein with Yx(FWY)xxD motif
MQRRLGKLSITAATLSMIIVMSACGSDSKSSDTAATQATTSSAATSAAPTSSAATAAAPASSAATAAAAPAGAKLAIVKDAKLGDIIVDAGGFTLYRFDKDTAEPPKSNCSGACVGNWPPVSATGKPEVTGIDAALVGTVKRDDNTEQVTIAGWPLYRFAADAAAGETKGQGVSGIWWAVTPTGAKAAAAG